MRCDIKFLIGGFNKTIEISKFESKEELDSIQDIIKKLIELGDDTKIQNLTEGLANAEVISTPELNKILDGGAEIIGNVTISDFKEMFPEVMSRFEDHGEQYTFALRDKVYLNGDELKGRVEHKGKVVYFIRNESDLKLFVNTERKKTLIKKFIDDDNKFNLELPKFQEYITKKYSSLLLDALNAYNKNKKNKLNLKLLLLHFLDYKNEFSIGESEDVKVDQRSLGEILNNFCLEFSNNGVYDSSFDSPLVKQLKFINFKMDSFGKKDLFNTLIDFGMQNVTEDWFVNANKDLIVELFNLLKEQDPSLKQYSIVSVDSSKNVEQDLKKDEFINLILQINNKRKIENPDFEEFVYNSKTTTYSELEEFLKDLLDSPITILNKKDLSLTLKKGKFGKPKLVYKTKSINNDDKIKLLYKGKPLEDLFGHITKKTFIPVNEEATEHREAIVNGLYKGYYIFKHIDTKTKLPQYIISKSIIRPNLYTKNIYNSLDEAILTIDGIFYNSPIKNFVIRSLNGLLYDKKIPRIIQYDKYLGPGSTISNLQYPVQFDKLNIINSNLLKLNFETAKLVLKNTYPNLDIDLLNTPEKVALFIYKMNNLGIYPKSIYALSETNIKELKQAITDINNAPTIYHIVELTYNNNIYLKKLDINSINSDGIVVKPGKTSLEKGKYISTISTLYKLKEQLLNSIFKDTPILIEITTNEKLKSLKDDNNKLLLDDIKGVKAFVHNNTIYVNSDIASTGDMIHETMHFALGAIRVKSPETYEKIVTYFSNKAHKLTLENVNNKYKGLAYIDKAEEIAVRYISNQLYNGTFSYNDDMSLVMSELELVFKDILKIINSAITDDSNSDIGFTNLFNQLFLSNDVLTSMLERRITTNIIQSKMNKEIYENCTK